MASVMPDRTKSDDPWDAVSTSHLLHRAQQLASDRFSVLVGENGITFRQYVILTAIAEAPGSSQAELARATGVDRSTLADLVQRLERRGMVERGEVAEDARTHALHLTGTGKETLENARQHARAADAAILDALPAAKRRSFHNLLLRLAEHADKLARKAEREAKRQAKREAKRRSKERKKTKAKAQKEAAATAMPSEKRKPRRKEGAR